MKRRASLFQRATLVLGVTLCFVPGALITFYVVSRYGADSVLVWSTGLLAIVGTVIVMRASPLGTRVLGSKHRESPRSGRPGDSSGE